MAQAVVAHGLAPAPKQHEGLEEIGALSGRANQSVSFYPPLTASALCA